MGTPGNVRTVLGDVPAADLGRTLIHEHVIISLLCYWRPEDDPAIAAQRVRPNLLGRIRANPFAARDNLVLDDIDVAAEELRRFREAGGGTIVEVTSANIGRDPVALRMVSRASGVHVVAGCGYYIGQSRPAGFSERTIEDLATEMVRDITVGIGDTGIRAGVIGEVAVSDFPMSADDDRLLRAAAAAQQETGAGMVVHPAPGAESAFELVDVLECAGADLGKVVVSHLDDRFRDDPSAFDRLAAAGCVLGLDTFGRELHYPARGRQLPSDDDRISTLGHLVDRGLTDQLALAQDICLRHELTFSGGHGYDHLLRAIVPRLERAGITEDSLERMLVSTPARVLTVGGLRAE